MEKKIHNINLKPLTEVNRWNTKRVKSYMIRIQKHISYLQVGYRHYNETEIEKKEKTIALEKFKNYKKNLKLILAKRENIE